MRDKTFNGGRRILLQRLAMASLVMTCIVSAPAGISSADANETQTVKIKKTMKAVSGEVSGISAGFLAIVYKRDKGTAYEIALYVDPSTKLERYKTLRDVKPGDMVRVTFEELTERPDEPEARTTLTAKQVSLMRPATAQLGSRESSQ